MTNKIPNSKLQKLTIGILDIQGSVEEHMAVLKRGKIPMAAVKNTRDLAKISGLIIPGGESTTISNLLRKTGLDTVIKKRAAAQTLALFGTCAGAIILAKKVKNCAPATLGLIDVEIARNAYGSQISSFETDIKVKKIGSKKFHAVFIRAPKIIKTSKETDILAEYQSKAIMVQQKNVLITAFHPELTADARIHKYFYSLCKRLRKNS